MSGRGRGGGGRLPVCLAAVLVLAGCAGPPPEPPVAASGKLVGYRGKSAEGVVVSLWPQDDPRGAVKSALCKADGTFSLECVPGAYKVTVMPRKPVGKGAAPGPQGPGTAPAPSGQDALIPEMYQSSVKTNLRVTVPAGGTGDLVVDLGKR